MTQQAVPNTVDLEEWTYYHGAVDRKRGQYTVFLGLFFPKSNVQVVKEHLILP
jgi:hypothetical protein